MRSDTTTIGTDPARAIVPTPRRPLRLADRTWLAWRGLRDTLRYRVVSDDSHTHTTLEILQQSRGCEAQVIASTRAALHQLEVRIAQLEQIAAARDESEEPLPSADELAGATPHERAAWAQRRHAIKRENARRRAAADRAHAAGLESAALRRDSQMLIREADAIRRLWAENHAERASRYTRARTHWLGRRTSASPAVPAYSPIDEPWDADGAADAL